MDFETVIYHLKSPKIKETVRFLLMSDLHGALHGPDNEEIVRAAGRIKPDFIFLAGDMITADDIKSYYTALHLTEKLLGIAPVYAVNGNHETGLRHHAAFYREYTERFIKTGADLLNNDSRKITVKGSDFSIYGLELPFEKYNKLRLPHLDIKEVRELIGPEPDSDSFSILLAHNPQFMREYFIWGADLVLSGHFHGGVIRFKNGRTLLSPYGFPFPKYGYGKFNENGHTGIVTAGLGEHWLPVRFEKNNPMEIAEICLEPDDQTPASRF